MRGICRSVGGELASRHFKSVTSSTWSVLVSVFCASGRRWPPWAARYLAGVPPSPGAMAPRAALTFSDGHECGCPATRFWALCLQQVLAPGGLPGSWSPHCPPTQPTTREGGLSVIIMTSEETEAQRGAPLCPWVPTPTMSLPHSPAWLHASCLAVQGSPPPCLAPP